MTEERVKLREKLAFGLGDAGASMFWKLFGMYLLYFYTDIFGIEATAVGTMFLITRIWDSLVDPVVGIIADRTESRWGKFRPYILMVAVPFGVIGVLTFTTPDLGPTGKLIYAYITYGLMMMTYSLINVPASSLLGVITSDRKTRTTLSSYKMIAAFAGSILVLLIIEPLVNLFSGNSTELKSLQFGWQMAIVVIAIIAIICFMGTFFWTQERVKPIKEQNNRLSDDIKDLLTNRPWWILLGAAMSAVIFNSIRDGATVYYFKYYVEHNNVLDLGFMSSAMSLTTIFFVLGQAANIIGIIAITPIANRIGKKRAFLFAMLIAVILSVWFYFVGRGDIMSIMILQFFISMCAGSIFPLLWSMYADIADYSEIKTGRRATGLVFSSSTMAQKFGWTLGGAVTGWLLGYFGFVANIEQADEAQYGIRLMLSFLPAAGALLSVIFISLYPLTEKKVIEIGEQLDILRKL